MQAISIQVAKDRRAGHSVKQRRNAARTVSHLDARRRLAFGEAGIQKANEFLARTIAGRPFGFAQQGTSP